MSVIRTVLGDIDPASLGVLDYHEHLFQTSPLLPGDELDDEKRSGGEAGMLVEGGVQAIIDATPTGLGRDAEATARISEATGLTVVHTTGAHHGGHYRSGDALLEMNVRQLIDLFTIDVASGFRLSDGAPAKSPGGAPVRAGLVKAGIRYWSIGTFERRVIEAAAATSLNTGCAVMVHLDFGSATHEVLDLIAAEGVQPDRVVLAHADRNLDSGLHNELAARGAYLGYDGMARHRDAPDSAILECLLRVVKGGGAARLLVGGDVARRTRYIAYGGMPGLSYLPLRFLPRLSDGLDPADYELVTRSNGARLLTLRS
ncbi:aryldialkylphosphatase [Subtercola boreus]|uniref:Aryldialkylphosphatase n=1 Tax=Subtercola boreus TaxID=120213 RepID=A0A3E0VTF4_9MICO|nr:aryldialkylphosphatase [Subtercola boreus]RFA13166.1 aryldialkylphosphatase [Subtercola boreus]